MDADGLKLEVFKIKVVPFEQVTTTFDAEYNELAFQALIVEIEQKIILTRVQKNRLVNEEFKVRSEQVAVAKTYRERILEALRNLFDIILGGK